MENIDYKILLEELINSIKDKTEYLKSVDSNDPSFNKYYYEGMAMAYHQVMDNIVSSLKMEEGIDLSNFNLDGYDPNEILAYKPL